MRRKPGTLLPLEIAILQTGIQLQREGVPQFHGFFIASPMRTREHSRSLTAHGTLYKALNRMEKASLLESCWEDPAIAAAEHRPLRRLYAVTGLGESALARAQAGVDPR